MGADSNEGVGVLLSQNRIIFFLFLQAKKSIERMNSLTSKRRHILKE
jgi:hypothetical protein